MLPSAHNLTLAASLLCGGVVLLGAVLVDSQDGLLVGAAVLTLASADMSYRLWHWARAVKASVAETGRRKKQWELGPGYVIGYFGVAVTLALMLAEAGHPLPALLTYPASVILMSWLMARAALPRLLRQLLFPTGPPVVPRSKPRSR